MMTRVLSLALILENQLTWDRAGDTMGGMWPWVVTIVWTPSLELRRKDVIAYGTGLEKALTWV